MSTYSEDNDTPAFAATIDSILNRYRAKAVERHNAVRALTAVTLALAAEGFFSESEDRQLDRWFGEKLDAYRAGEAPEQVRKHVVSLISAAAIDNRDAVASMFKL